MSSALVNIHKNHPGVTGQNSQGDQGPMAWIKSVLSGEFLDDDYSKNRDTDKVSSYLDQSYKNLASIVKVRRT
jgi:hypothetical protein